jgi:hypothetical protein
MQYLEQLTPDGDLSGAWCDDSAVATSTLEAVSFVTPVLESLFISAVGEGLTAARAPELDRRCRAFIREEVSHSRAHNKLNASLLGYLGAAPPGLALVQSLVSAARKHLSLAQRMLLVAALEHFTAVLSKDYLRRAPGWGFGCDFARELFVRHAREELAHRAVAFDLWRCEGHAGGVARTAAVTAIGLAGLAYLSVAVPWILYRKTGQRLGGTVAALAGSTMSRGALGDARSLVGELYRFTRGRYHPDQLVEDRPPGA